MTGASGQKKTRDRMADAVGQLSWEQIDLSVRAGDQIYRVLRGAILAMDIAPGCPLSEAAIGAKLGASRTPVREALLRLREEGLVCTFASRGSFVSKLSRGAILEAQFLREALEVANVAKVAETPMSPDIDAGLAANLAAQGEAVRQGNSAQFHELDDDFHGLIADATGFTGVSKVLNREKVQLDRLRHLYLKREGHLPSLLAEHQSIYVHLADQNVGQAVAQMRAHCRSVLDVLEDLSRQNREYFE